MNQLMKILIAYDGSTCADAALEDMRYAGLPSEAEVVILSVAEHWLPPPPPSSYEILAPHLSHSPHSGEEEALALSRRAGAYIQSAFPAWKVHAEIASGSPAPQVIKKAEQWKPDLIVIGSHGHTALARLILGSVSQKVVTEAFCSVRVARGRTDSGDRPVRIIIGVDGSLQADAAVEVVAARLWREGSAVKIISVIERPFTPSEETRSLPDSAYSKMERDGQEQAQIAINRAVERLRAREGNPLAITAESILGRAKESLLDAAEEWDADLIVLGSHGYRGFKRFRLGSVALAVATYANCSVEIVRNRAEDNDVQAE